MCPQAGRSQESCLQIACVITMIKQCPIGYLGYQGGTASWSCTELSQPVHSNTVNSKTPHTTEPQDLHSGNCLQKTNSVDPFQ